MLLWGNEAIIGATKLQGVEGEALFVVEAQINMHTYVLKAYKLLNQISDQTNVHYSFSLRCGSKKE